MISDDLRNLSRTLANMAAEERTPTLLETTSIALTLRSLANRVAIMESRPIPPGKRWPVVDGGGDNAA